VDWLVAAAPQPGGPPALVAGPVLSYFEFKQPAAERLTDEEWREALQKRPPERPAWTASFVSP
jgi:hypothetical protein